MAAQSRVLPLDDRLASTPQGGRTAQGRGADGATAELDRPESARERAGRIGRFATACARYGSSSLARLVSIATVSRNCCRPSPVFSWSAPRHPRAIRSGRFATASQTWCWSTPRTARRGDTVRLILGPSSKSHVIAFAVR